MKEEIKSARLVIQSERGTRPGSGLVGDVKGAGEVLDELPFATKLK